MTAVPEIQARVAIELRRAGLRASEDQVAGAASAFERTQQQLAAMREWLRGPALEPATTFAPLGGDGDHKTS